MHLRAHTLTIHRLGARTLIRTLESDLRGEEEQEEEGQKNEKVEALKKKVIDLSVQSGVSSVLTAFIAVHAGSGQSVQGPLLRRNVPTVCLGAPMPMACMARSAARSQLLCDSLCDLEGEDGAIMDFACDYSLDVQEPELIAEKAPRKDPLQDLISLQKASGSWELVPELAQVFGKTEDEMTRQMPVQVDGAVWATVLALLWLYGFRLEDQEEWQFVAMKAASWIRAKTGCSASQCVQAGNTLLGCQVQEGTLGL
ncbi:von Willebrand factor A domain-containing protein 5A-like [Megalops cyprinoides]|uniref:von Willebrand factor A domain-containing protein 5A-like n=1 Tax=Megalops cyprinoides TaxID=118141 RepID=UPI001864378F|nr:von Willebrand factor A domain-containing protein 5A-like [Megalops cyprinoides]